MEPSGPVAYEYRAFVLDGHDNMAKLQVNLGFNLFTDEWIYISDPPFKKALIGSFVTIRCRKHSDKSRYFADIWIRSIQYHSGLKED